MLRVRVAVVEAKVSVNSPAGVFVMIREASPEVLLVPLKVVVHKVTALAVAKGERARTKEVSLSMFMYRWEIGGWKTLDISVFSDWNQA